MPEHRISLRRAWQSPLGRIDLPTDWSGAPAPDRLWRRFNRPPIEEGAGPLVLRLQDVPGLVRARLNGRDLGPPPIGAPSWEVPIPDLRPSGNRLDLDLDLDRAATLGPTGWGRIALVVPG